MKSIKYNNIKVYYTDELEGGGQLFGQQFIPVVKNLFGKVDVIYEICAGPAFMGFSLLANNLCNKLVLSDINPKAVKIVKKTIKENKLQGKVKVYLSNGLKQVPKQKFDLVIANPPHYSKSKFGITNEDTNWRLHKHFYRSIHKYLKFDGNVLFRENYLGSVEKDFIPMAKNLKYIDSFMYKIKEKATPNTFYFMWFKKDNNGLMWSGDEIKTLHLYRSSSEKIQLKSYKKYLIKFHNDGSGEVEIAVENNNHRFFKATPFLFCGSYNLDEKPIIFTKGIFKLINRKTNDIYAEIEVL